MMPRFRDSDLGTVAFVLEVNKASSNPEDTAVAPKFSFPALKSKSLVSPSLYHAHCSLQQCFSAGHLRCHVFMA